MPISPSPQPQSKPPEAPPPTAQEAELARKQMLLAKVRVLRERTTAANLGDIQGKDPNKCYVWVNVADNRQITFQSLGYEVCRDPNIKCPWKKENGTYVRGDLILYQCDKDLYEAIQLDCQLQAIEGVENASEGFKSVAYREGVPIYEPGKRS